VTRISYGKLEVPVHCVGVAPLRDLPSIPESPVRALDSRLLRFAVGDYFADGAEPPFLDVVPVRFGVSDPGAHHHVPLLVTPGGYSTYRGS
jgi:5-hydroxyisourate hydrolase-like protein (transthyretin family)